MCVLTFPSRPTIRVIADQLLRDLTGTETPSSRSRFDLTTRLTGLLATPMRLTVVNEAQRLTGDCIELLRHLHDHPRTRFALLYVGGDGCWEVISKEPMLRSRVFRRLPFQPINPVKVPALMRRYHPIYEATPRTCSSTWTAPTGTAPCATGPSSPTPPPPCVRSRT